MPLPLALHPSQHAKVSCMNTVHCMRLWTSHTDFLKNCYSNFGSLFIIMSVWSPLPFFLSPKISSSEKKFKNLDCLKKCYWHISYYCWSLSMHPENNRKPEVFWCFQGGQKKINSIKWVNPVDTRGRFNVYKMSLYDVGNVVYNSDRRWNNACLLGRLYRDTDNISSDIDKRCKKSINWVSLTVETQY